MDITITKLVVSFSVHATENLEKNLELLNYIIPSEILEQTDIVVDELEGGYQNSIDFVSIPFTKSSSINKIISKVSNIIPIEEKEKLSSEFDERFDQKNNMFYIRLDKEDLFCGKATISSSANIIKLAMKLRAFTKDAKFQEFLVAQKILI